LGGLVAEHLAVGEPRVVINEGVQAVVADSGKALLVASGPWWRRSTL
jgi:hypothetical protein